MRLTNRLWSSRPAYTSYYTNVKPTSTRQRDVVDRSLCNSIINILQPTFPKPKSCDVIDVNPGNCVWSQAVNQILQPRNHILIEQSPDKLEEHVRPWTEQSNNSFKLESGLGVALADHSLGYFSKQGLQDAALSQDRQWSGSVNTEQNQGLIIFANLGGYVKDKSGFAGDYAKIFAYQYYRSLTIGAVPYNIHRDGLVRLIAWLPESSKHSINPRSIVGRTALSTRLEASCTIREIASSFPYDGLTAPYRRYYPLDLESMKTVADRQAPEGLAVDTSRMQPSPMIPAATFPPDPSSFPSLEKLKVKPPFIDELIKLDREVCQDDPEWYHRYHQNIDGHRTFYKQDPKRSTYRLLMRRLRGLASHYEKSENLIIPQRTLVKQLIDTATDKFGSISYDKATEKITHKLEVLQQQTDGLFKDDRKLVGKALDDYRMMDLPRPVLSWNQREFEPLLTKKSDFIPHAPMTLLEFTPKPEFVKAIGTLDKMACFDYVVFVFISLKGQSVSAALQSLIGGEEDEFVRLIPNISNPAKGGWYDLKKIRARTLPVELIVEITLAFYDWPFRPEIKKMVELMSSKSRLKR